MKYFFLSLIPAVLFPSIALAQSSAPITYTLMAPLTGYLSGTPTLSQYLQGVVQVTIGLAGILAVIMLIYCGIKLMGTPSAGAKSEAKECIWNAIFGVLLAVGAWILLYTINPLLLSSDLALTDVAVAPAAAAPRGPVTDPYPIKQGWYFKYSDDRGTHYDPPGGTSSAELCAKLIEPAKSAGKTIIPLDDGRICFEVPRLGVVISQSEQAVRQALCGNTSCVGSTPIGINAQPCPYVGARGCTNVAGLPQSAIDFIKSLQAGCNCTVIITGGTEYWLHKTHAANQPIFDLRLRQGDAATNYILANGTGKRYSFSNYRVYLNGFWLTNEGNHWHACQDTLSTWYCTNYTTPGKTAQVDSSTALIK